MYAEPLMACAACQVQWGSLFSSSTGINPGILSSTLPAAIKGKERKALTEQIQRTEKEIAENLDKLPDVLKEDGYPDVQAFMATYRKAEAVVEQYNRDLAAWERKVREKRKPAQKEQAKPPERESVLKRLRQLQAEGKQRNQPRQRKKSFDRDSR